MPTRGGRGILSSLLPRIVPRMFHSRHFSSHLAIVPQTHAFPALTFLGSSRERRGGSGEEGNTCFYSGLEMESPDKPGSFIRPVKCFACRVVDLVSRTTRDSSVSSITFNEENYARAPLTLIFIDGAAQMRPSRIFHYEILPIRGVPVAGR